MNTEIIKRSDTTPKLRVYDSIPAGTTLVKHLGMGVEDGKFVTYWESSLGTIAVSTIIHLD